MPELANNLAADTPFRARDAVNIRPSLAPRTGGRGSNVPRPEDASRDTRVRLRYRLFLRYWYRHAGRKTNGLVHMTRCQPA